MRNILSLLFLSILTIGNAQQECIDPSLIDPDAICTTEFNPVCGCDGITYSNQCVAVTTGGVTEFTFGECGENVDCFDLINVDFGECEMIMGIGVVDGECVAISGCGWEVGGVDYSPYSFDSFAQCQNECVEDDCLDLEGIDFGLCDMAMGIALIEGECIAVSGCGWEVDGADYSPYFYDNIEDCEACIGGEDCFDLDGIDFGLCTAVLGIGYLNGTCTTISGCDWEVGGIDYSPYFFETFEECESICPGPCEDPTIIDPDFECGIEFEPVCGCDDKTYWNACHAENYNGITSWEEGPCSCPDATAIDPEIFCFDLYDPVCGCDDVTYTNECVAYYMNGITEWVPGECGMSVEQLDQLSAKVFPNPVNSLLTIQLNNTTSGSFELYDLSGKTVMNGKLIGVVNKVDLSALSAGTYLLRLASGNAQMQVPIYKID